MKLRQKMKTTLFERKQFDLKSRKTKVSSDSTDQLEQLTETHCALAPSDAVKAVRIQS
jgi:hypothetical protein